jgi:hypothetical protein
MKAVLEILDEVCAATAAVLWFVSARFRLKGRKVLRRGLDRDIVDPKALMLLVGCNRGRSGGALCTSGRIAARYLIAANKLARTNKEVGSARQASGLSSNADILLRCREPPLGTRKRHPMPPTSPLPHTR